MNKLKESFHKAPTLLQNFLNFASGQTLFLAASFVHRIVAARVLGISDFGNFAIVELMLMAGGFVGLGVAQGMYRQLPKLLGAGDHENALKLQYVTLSYGIGVLVILATSSLMTFAFPMSAKMRTSVFIAVLGLGLSLINGFFEFRYRATERFDLVRGSLSLAGWVQFFNIPLISAFGFYGSLIGLLIPRLARIGYGVYYIGADLQYRWYINYSLLITLIKSGFPILLLEYSSWLNDSLDRWLVLAFFGTPALGLYVSARTVAGAIGGLFVQPINSVVFARSGFLIGSENDPKKTLAQLALRINKALFLTIPILGSLMLLAIPYIIGYLIPDYIDGTIIAQIILTGTCLLSLSTYAGSILVNLDRVKYLYLFYGISIMTNILIAALFLWTEVGIEAVAFARIGGQIVYGLLLVFAMLWSLGTIKSELSGYINRFMLGAFLLGLAWLVDYSFPPNLETFSSFFVREISFLVLSIIYLALLILFVPEFRFRAKHFKDVIFQWKRG